MRTSYLIVLVALGSWLLLSGPPVSAQEAPTVLTPAQQANAQPGQGPAPEADAPPSGPSAPETVVQPGRTPAQQADSPPAETPAEAPPPDVPEGEAPVPVEGTPPAGASSENSLRPEEKLLRRACHFARPLQVD